MKFKTKILLNFISLYFFLGASFSYLLISIIKENTEELIGIQKEWLLIYSKDFLNDYKTGEHYSIDGKLKGLIQNKPFRRIRLKIGRFERTFTKKLKKELSFNPFRELIFNIFFSNEKIVIILEDNTKTKWGETTFILNRDQFFLPHVIKIEQFFIYLVSIFLVFFGFLLVIIQSIEDPLRSLKNYFSSFSAANYNEDEIKSALSKDIKYTVIEFGQLFREFKAAINTIFNLKQEVRKNQIDSEISKVASQVAHDIRSPLTSLETFSDKNGFFDENERISFRDCIQGIKDIANNLLASYNSNLHENQKIMRSTLLGPLLETIISEKRLQFKKIHNVNIYSSLDSKNYGLFSKINSLDFQRVISNIINNSVDSMMEKINIKVELYQWEENNIVEISDTGQGIDSNILEEVFDEGKSFNKENGSGIGLFHAKSKIEYWDGEIKLTSTRGEGTKVKVIIPQSAPQSWFIGQLDFFKNSKVVILDDDPNIHNVWKKRFFSLPFKENNIEVIHFFCYEKTQHYFNSVSDLSRIIFLTDFELLNKNYTGLDVIEKFRIFENSFLITSHFNNKDILSRCRAANIKLVPKSMANIIPLNIFDISGPSKNVKSPYDIVHLEDEKFLRSRWIERAKACNLNLLSLECPYHLGQFAHKFGQNTKFYIDYSLGAGKINGLKIVKNLKLMGHREVYLATGHDLEFFNCEELDIRDKNPPF